MVTELQKQVWKKLKEIPQGRVTTYACVARAVGRPKAVRAVASAVGKNPDLIQTPCHRVILSDGSVGRYAQGTPKKISLLQQEGIQIENMKIELNTYQYFF